MTLPMAHATKRRTNRRGLLGTVVMAGVIGAVSLSGCGSKGSEPADNRPPSGSSTTAAAPSLAGTSWVLQPASLGVAVPAGVQVTIVFTPDQVSGNSGCNRYSGAYTTPGRDGLSFGPLMSTKMACEKGPATVESAYLAKLGQVGRYAIAADLLTLADDTGATLLTYTTNEAKPAN